MVPLPNGVSPKLGGDKGYSGTSLERIARNRGYDPYLMQRMVTYEKGYLPRRWMVERLHSWLNRCRKLLVRFEKWTESYEGLVHFALAIICFKMADVF